MAYLRHGRLMGDQARWGQVIDALVAKAKLLPGYRDPEEDKDGTTVWDGPQMYRSEDHASGAHLVIGFGGTSDAPTPSATSDWTSGPIAGTVHPRDETTVVMCRAVGQHAGTVKEARDAATAVLADVAGLLRDDPSLGINTSATIGGVRLLTFVTAGSMAQYDGPNGFVCDIEFSVTYSGRV